MAVKVNLYVNSDDEAIGHADPRDGLTAPYRPLSRYPARRRLYLAGQAIRDFNDRGPAVNLLIGAGAIEAAMSR